MGIGFGAVESSVSSVQINSSLVQRLPYLHRYLSLTKIGRGAVGYKTRICSKDQWNHQDTDFRTTPTVDSIDGFFCYEMGELCEK